MTLQRISRQRGITFIGLLFIGSVVGVSGVIAAQVAPTYMEYQMVVKAVNKAADGGSVPEIRNIFEKATQIDNINSIKASDLEITKEGEKVVVRFAYEREIHLAGPAWLTLKYQGRSK